ncbi:MgtC/SapB family protein [Subdoligranulum variabile]|uniref:MgtC/SapB family protein n=1 Tax=Subdoligranulum variabile TaxID=214851 RepID=UPI00294357B1|nr:MgtC/SapB family protein [Subdoligranulum variabile]
MSFPDQPQIASVILRVILCVVCGGVLGIERGKANQPAGMRTHILVTLGAALVMMTGEYMFTYFASGDPARLGAQVISGIGFLGAGSIIVEGRTKIRGLTTAAELWTAACIGLAIGIGFWTGGILVTAVVYLVISKSKAISDYFTHNNLCMRVYIEFDTIGRLQEIDAVIVSFGMEVQDVMVNRSQSGCNAILALKNPTNRSERQIINCLEKVEGVARAKSFD